MRHFQLRPVPLLVAGTFLVHMLVNRLTPYGVHRDEFLYMAMGRHLRLWQMDFPPLIAMMSEASRLFGDSLVDIRILPAAAGAMLVWLAARFAREMGGGIAAQSLAAVAVVANPLFLRAGNLFQPVIFDQLWWTLGLYALMHIAREPEPRAAHRWWMLLGVFGGLGLLTKFSIAFFAIGAVAAVLLTPLRMSLLTRWPWVAALIGLAIGSPSIVGQLVLDFPVVGQMRDLQGTQLERVGPADFVMGQLLLGPCIIIAAFGVFTPLFLRRMPAARVVAIACAGSFVALLLLRGKAYYLGPIYPALFGIGAAALMPLDRVASVRRTSLYWTVLVGVVAYGIATLPFGLPILPPARMAAYATAMGIESAVRTNAGEVQQLPQDYADMLGWPAQTEAVLRAYSRLAPSDQQRVVIAAGNYGQAGALDFHGARQGLPATVSSAGSYWFFGPGTRSGDIMLVLAERDGREDLESLFGRVEVVETVRSPEQQWLVSEERDVVVFLCTLPRMSIQQAWPSLAGRN